MTIFNEVLKEHLSLSCGNASRLIHDYPRINSTWRHDTLSRSRSFLSIFALVQTAIPAVSFGSLSFLNYRKPLRRCPNEVGQKRTSF